MINLIINTQFAAIHNYPDCNIPEVTYLKDPHRHTFHLKLKFKVIGDNREIEFIALKEKIEHYIREGWVGQNLGEMSCEQIAETFAIHWNAFYVRVMEDNENGAEYIKEDTEIDYEKDFDEDGNYKGNCPGCQQRDERRH